MNVNDKPEMEVAAHCDKLDETACTADPKCGFAAQYAVCAPTEMAACWSPDNKDDCKKQQSCTWEEPDTSICIHKGSRDACSWRSKDGCATADNCVWYTKFEAAGAICINVQYKAMLDGGAHCAGLDEAACTAESLCAFAAKAKECVPTEVAACLSKENKDDCTKDPVCDWNAGVCSHETEFDECAEHEDKDTCTAADNVAKGDEVNDTDSAVMATLPLVTLLVAAFAV